MNKIITGVIAGVIVFAWGMASWMMLPWHKDSFSEFRGGNVAAKSILLATPESGMYVHPTWDTPPEEASKQPKILTVVNHAQKNMMVCMIKGLLIQIVAGILLACAVSMAKLETFKDKLVLTFKIALFAGIVGVLPNWLWWSFTPHYTVLGIADLLIGWSIAGIVIAKRV